MRSIIKDRSFYIYEHIRLDNFTPFYIGKGKGNRAYVPKRNEHHDRIVDKYGYTVVILYDNLTEEEAFELERDCIEDLVFNEGYGIDIKGYKRYEDTQLTNQTWGGEGASGHNLSEKHKNIIRERLGNQQGVNNYMYGKKHTKEAKEKNRQSHLGKKATLKTKKLLSKQRKGENNPRAKAIYCYEFNEIRPTAKQWGMELGFNSSMITDVCKGNHKSTHGYHFRYATEEEIEEYKNNLKMKGR